MVSFNEETQGTVKNALIGSPRPESYGKRQYQIPHGYGEKNRIRRKIKLVPLKHKTLCFDWLRHSLQSQATLRARFNWFMTSCE